MFFFSFFSYTKSRRLTFFGHLIRLDENAVAGQAIFELPPENWRLPPGRLHATWMKNIHDDLFSLYLRIYEARDLAQNRPLLRLMSLHSYALVVVHAVIGVDWILLLLFLLLVFMV